MSWIKIEDKLPDPYEKVLVYHNGMYFGILCPLPGDETTYNFVIDNLESGNIITRPIDYFSHWMPLPHKPNEEQ